MFPCGRIDSFLKLLLATITPMESRYAQIHSAVTIGQVTLLLDKTESRRRIMRTHQMSAFDVMNTDGEIIISLFPNAEFNSERSPAFKLRNFPCHLWREHKQRGPYWKLAYYSLPRCYPGCCQADC